MPDHKLLNMLQDRHGRYTSIILEFRRLRQENQEFKASLGYIVIPCLK
jgi:hypothetical protein